MVAVGNGGFSLRRIQYCIKLLERWKWLPYLTTRYLWKMYSTEEIMVIGVNIIYYYLFCVKHVLKH